MPCESYGISRKLTRPKRPELLPQIHSLVLSGRLSRSCHPQDMPPRTLRGLLLLEKPHELSAAYDRTRAESHVSFCLVILRGRLHQTGSWVCESRFSGISLAQRMLPAAPSIQAKSAGM
jgi:hypothetical protein